MLKMITLLFSVTLAAFGAQRMTEIPAGTLDGTQTSFQLTALPYSDTLKLFKNGMMLLRNVDYMVSSQSISFTNPPAVGDSLLVAYDVLIPNGFHMLINKATGSCITPFTTNKIIQAACAGTDAQKFGSSLSTFGYVLTVKSSNQVLDLLNSGTFDGTALIQSAASGSRSQQWQPLSLDNDQFFELTNALTNGVSCLTLSSGSVVLQTCTGLDTQKWQWQ